MECIVDSETGGIGFRGLNTDDDTVEFFATYDDGEVYTKEWSEEEFKGLFAAISAMGRDELSEETKENIGISSPA